MDENDRESSRYEGTTNWQTRRETAERDVDKEDSKTDGMEGMYPGGD